MYLREYFGPDFRFSNATVLNMEHREVLQRTLRDIRQSRLVLQEQRMLSHKRRGGSLENLVSSQRLESKRLMTAPAQQMHHSPTTRVMTTAEFLNRRRHEPSKMPEIIGSEQDSWRSQNCAAQHPHSAWLSSHMAADRNASTAAGRDPNRMFAAYSQNRYAPRFARGSYNDLYRSGRLSQGTGKTCFLSRTSFPCSVGVQVRF